MRTAILGFVGALLVLGCGSSDDGRKTTTPDPEPVGLWEQREVLGHVPARHDGQSSLRIDGDRVYVGVNEIGQDGSPAGAYVYAFLKDGGASFVTLGGDFTKISRLHDEGLVVFVVSPGADADTVSAVSKTDGATTVLGSTDQIMAMTADETNVYVACLGGAYADGPSIQVFERESGDKSEFWPMMGDVRALAVGGGDLYVATNAVGLWRRELTGATDPVRIGLPVLPAGAQVTFTAGAERLFWAAAGTLGEVSLADGSVSEEPYDSTAERMGRLSSSGDALVWSELDGRGMGVGVMHWSLGSGDHVFGEMTPVGPEVVTDGSYVYGLTGTELWRLPLDMLAQ